MNFGEAKGETRRRFSAADLLVLLVVTVLGAISLAHSWNRWLDPIVDVGRDLYIPEQLPHGAKLYRDIVYFYPPLTPYLLAVVTAVTGSSLTSYTWIGIAIAAATALAIYALGRVVGSRLSGGFAAALFAACSVATPWSRGGNYLFPYAHAATIGMLLLIVFAAFLGAFLFVRRSPPLLLGALLCALAASWTKIEFAIFAAVILAAMAIVHRIDWRWIAGYAAALLTTTAAVSFVFRDAPPDRTWFRGNVLPEAMVGSRSLADFYARVTGLEEWRSLLHYSVLGAAAYVAIAFLLRFATGRRKAVLLAAASILALAIGWSPMFFRAWTILIVVTLIVSLRRPREPLLLLSLLALFAASRIPFNVAPQWYGFVFCVPVYLLAAYLLFDWLPEKAVYTREAALVWCAGFAATMAFWLLFAGQIYRESEYRIETARGPILTDNRDKAEILNQAWSDVRGRGIRSIAFFPEGLGLNYLWRIPTPLAYYTFTPPETASPLGEAHALADFEARKPEWVAIVGRDVREFGYRGFGADYDLMLADAIRRNYRMERKWTARGFEFFLLRRRDAAAGATMPSSVSRE